MLNEDLTGLTPSIYIGNKWDEVFPHLHAKEFKLYMEPELPTISRIVVENESGEQEIVVSSGEQRELQIMELIIKIYEALQQGQSVRIVRKFGPIDTSTGEGELEANAAAITLIKSMNIIDFAFFGEDRDWPTARLPRDLITFLSPINLHEITLTPIPQQPPDSRQ